MKRKKLKGVAAGVLDNFIARYNEIDGYWAVGKIFKSLKGLGCRNIEIDVLKLISTPNISQTDDIVYKLKKWLLDQIEKNFLDIKIIAHVKISIDFLVFKASHSESFIEQAIEGPFVVTAKIIDDQSKQYIASKTGWCWAHDPNRESRSASN